MNANKHPMIIVCTGIIIAVGRYLMRYIPDNQIYDYVNLIFMAVVNYVAIGIVLLFIHIDAQILCMNKIARAGISTADKEKRRTCISAISIIVIIVYLIGGLLYVIKLKNADLNDAISIVALALSIAANELSALLGNIYWKISSFTNNKLVM